MNTDVMTGDAAGDPGNRPGTGLSACVTCGAPGAGVYCSTCGEKRSSARDLSLRGFVRGALESVTNLDSRLFRSLLLLVTRPGLLTAEFVRGRRQPYLSPLQLFLVANVIFFVAEPFLPVVTLDTPLNVHLQSAEYGTLARRMVRARLTAHENADYTAFVTRFDYAAKQHAKSLFIILTPFFGGAVALLRLGRREPAGQHLAFALHLLAFMMLLFVCVAALVGGARLFVGEDGLPGSHWSIPAVVVVALMAYLHGSYRNAYGAQRATAVVLAALTAVLILPGLLLYRFLLFFTVFLTT